MKYNELTKLSRSERVINVHAFAYIYSSVLLSICRVFIVWANNNKRIFRDMSLILRKLVQIQNPNQSESQQISCVCVRVCAFSRHSIDLLFYFHMCFFLSLVVRCWLFLFSFQFNLYLMFLCFSADLHVMYTQTKRRNDANRKFIVLCF